MQFIPIGPQVIDLTNKRFGRLLVLGPIAKAMSGTNYRIIWLCKCDCGTLAKVAGVNLRQNFTKECRACKGCRVYSLTSPLYKLWIGMKQRCHNPKNENYARYGAKGIRVCETWIKDFRAFERDMGPRPSPTHTIDRIDNEGGYSPENTRWATQVVQGNNRRSNVLVTAHGKTQTVAEWSRELGIPYARLIARVSRGLSPERALANTLLISRGIMDVSSRYAPPKRTRRKTETPGQSTAKA